MKQLKVYFHEKPAGILLQDTLGKYSFQYDTISRGQQCLAGSNPAPSATFISNYTTEYYNYTEPKTSP
jgi:hypothetical protein